MKINTGIVTERLQDSKRFYQELFRFTTIFENEVYVLMQSPDHKTRLSFLRPDHPAKPAALQSTYAGQGIFLTMEVKDIGEEYWRVIGAGADIAVPLQSDIPGKQHFAFYDPNGIIIEVIPCSQMEREVMPARKRLLPGHL